LPLKATDPDVPLWIISKAHKETEYKKYGVIIEFGSDKVNIGDISTGKVKPVIDCLYPIIGGTPGRPDDWRIDELYIIKGKCDLDTDSIRIKILTL